MRDRARTEKRMAAASIKKLLNIEKLSKISNKDAGKLCLLMRKKTKELLKS